MDKTTKILLAAIAIGLWANAIVPLVVQKARADDDQMSNDVESMRGSVDSIAAGTCLNRKIC
jgi:hypothetical protein